MFGIKKRIIAAIAVSLIILGGGVYAASTGIVPLSPQPEETTGPVPAPDTAIPVEDVKQVPPAN